MEDELQKCPTCKSSTKYIYSRALFNGNKDDAEYCDHCNPELVKECEDFCKNENKDN